LGDEIKKNGIGGYVVRMGEERSSYGGGHEGKRLLGTPRLRWKDNIQVVLQEVEWGPGVDWFGSG